MPRYMILHNANETAEELMKASPDDKQAAIDDWMKWKTEAEKTVKFEWGLPMNRVGRVTTNGPTDSDNPATGYSIIEADTKEAVLAVLKNHPHLMRAGATLDVFELIPMSQM